MYIYLFSDALNTFYYIGVRNIFDMTNDHTPGQYFTLNK